MKNIIKQTFVLAAVTLLTIGCSDDFLDVNDNPNDPPVSTPSLTLPVAEQSFTSLNATSMTYLGEFMTYAWTTPSNWSANGDLIRYNVTTTFFSNIFETSYATIFKDLTYVQNFKDPTGGIDYSAYNAIALTIKGFQYQYLVDLYGDIPYTEANQRGDLFTPAYDDAETVYKANIDSLTVAATRALNQPSNAENPGTQDIIYGGKMDGWARFANTIKLRMLIRLSGTSQDAYIKSEIAKIAANGAGFVSEDVTTNPGYTDNDSKQSPFYGYIGRGPNDVAIDRSDFTVGTDYIIALLNNTNDDRLSRLYKLPRDGSAFKGAPQTTILPGTGFTSNDLSKVGPGFLTESSQDQIIMLLAESLLLQAEAAVREYLPGGNTAAEDFYNSAIEASYTTLGVPDAIEAAKTYYGQNLPNVTWSSSPNKIEAIITQKWIALNGTNGIEPWIELTRTGFPANLPIPTDSDGKRPVRLLYPASEVARNTGNVPALTKDDAFNKLPFWKQ